jgi:hypothetical protein
MRITPDLDKKKFFERKVFRQTQKVFVKCREAVVNHSEHTDPERLKAFVATLLNVVPMKEHLDNVWSDVGGRFAYDTQRKLNKKKSGNPDLELKADSEQLKQWKERMKKYSAERSLAKAKAIMTTEQEAINKVIDSVIQESLDQGLGIQETRKLLTSDLSGEQMLEMENWQAQRIAMTEVGGAQNTGSFEAANENPEGTKKIWMFIPGQKSFRENHQEYEGLGAVDMDYEFAPGLQYPGDENGSAEEVINCYCSIIYETE